jgi:hypothetical protein
LTRAVDVVKGGLARGSRYANRTLALEGIPT